MLASERPSLCYAPVRFALDITHCSSSRTHGAAEIYGLFVTTSSLLVATDAWPLISGPLQAIETIKRERAWTNFDGGSGVRHDNPEYGLYDEFNDNAAYLISLPTRSRMSRKPQCPDAAVILQEDYNDNVFDCVPSYRTMPISASPDS